MRIAGLMKNDMVDGQGFCVSLWMQGCPHHCKGCQNPETWDFNGGTEIGLIPLWDEIDNALNANNVKRNFSILGGEPLCPENILNTNSIGLYVKNNYPDRKIFLWTGYTIEEIIKMGEPYNYCFLWADVIIDGRYIEEQRDISLELRGSKNQRVITIDHYRDGQNVLMNGKEIIYVYDPN